MVELRKLLSWPGFCFKASQIPQSADDHGNLGAGIGISYSRNSVATLISSNFFINADLPERKNIGDHWKEN